MTLNSVMHSYLIITDIDGTLMDHNYDYSPALEVIEFLKKNNIPVVPCTSKTASEVRKLRRDIGLIDPYIVENGGAIYGNNKNGDEWEIILGRSYDELRIILDNLSTKIDYKLIALNDLSNQSIYELTGLDDKSIEMALDRHWSVPFLNPPENLQKLIDNYSYEMDISIYKGNRMSHLLAKGSNKGIAIRKLINYMQFDSVDLKVIGLGDSPNDIPLLEAVDIPVVIPGLDGPNQAFYKSINEGKYILADYPNAFGWSQSIKNIIGF